MSFWVIYTSFPAVDVKPPTKVFWNDDIYSRGKSLNKSENCHILNYTTAGFDAIWRGEIFTRTATSPSTWFSPVNYDSTDVPCLKFINLSSMLVCVFTALSKPQTRNAFAQPLCLLGNPKSLIPCHSKRALLQRLCVVGSNESYLRLRVNCPIFLSVFNQILKLFAGLSQKFTLSNFTEIRLVGEALIHADRRTNMTKVKSAFHGY